jgi:hypothetical protein
MGVISRPEAWQTLRSPPVQACTLVTLDVIRLSALLCWFLAAVGRAICRSAGGGCIRPAQPPADFSQPASSSIGMGCGWGGGWEFASSVIAYRRRRGGLPMLTPQGAPSASAFLLPDLRYTTGITACCQLAARELRTPEFNIPLNQEILAHRAIVNNRGLVEESTRPAQLARPIQCDETFLACPAQGGAIELVLKTGFGRDLVLMAMPLRNVTSLLLAAMLLGAAVAPPALRHAHPTEDGVAGHHQHDGHHARADGHRHCDGARQPTTLSELSGGHWWHLHFHVFGFEFTLPEPSPSHRDHEPERNVELLVLAPGREWSSGSSSRCDSLRHGVPPSAFFPIGDAACMQIDVSAPPPVSCAPLCDSARRERSGVLLA